MEERYLIVSLGSIGLRHLKNLRYLKPSSKIAILHLQNKSNDIPNEADFCFINIQDAINFSPIAAIICSPASLHVKIASQLIARKIHVLIEKPISDKLDGLDPLLETATKMGVLVMTGYNLRFLSSLIKVKAIIKSDLIGKILSVKAEVGQYLPDWRPNTNYINSVSAKKDLGGGVLLELSHEIDYLYSIFGMPHKIFAIGGTYSSLEIDVEDMILLNMEYNIPNKMMVNIHMDFIQRKSCRSSKFIGSEGTIFWDVIEDEIVVYKSDKEPVLKFSNLENSNRNTMYIQELKHFLTCISKGETPQIDGYQGRDVLRIVDAAKKSIQNNSIVNLN